MCRGRSRKRGLKETLATVFIVFYREYDDDEDWDNDDEVGGGEWGLWWWLKETLATVSGDQSLK